MSAPFSIKSTRTATAQHGINVLIHGAAGSGKTTLCGTCCAPHKTLIISAEAGLLSLADKDIPVIEVKTVDMLQKVYAWIAQEKPDYQWICLDSISEIAEVVLHAEKQNSKDPRQAYGALLDRMVAVLKAFRDLPGYNVLMTAKTERVKDEATGALLYSPMMPGSKLGQQLPYLFDEVLYLRVDTDDDGNAARWLQTGKDYTIDAKDRSGKLDFLEPPDMATLAAKIMAGIIVSGASARHKDPVEQAEPGLGDELIAISLDEIAQAADIDTLKRAYKSAESLAQSRGDEGAAKQFKAAANARKKELLQSAANNEAVAEAA